VNMNLPKIRIGTIAITYMVRAISPSLDKIFLMNISFLLHRPHRSDDEADEVHYSTPFIFSPIKNKIIIIIISIAIPIESVIIFFL